MFLFTFKEIFKNTMNMFKRAEEKKEKKGTEDR